MTLRSVVAATLQWLALPLYAAAPVEVFARRDFGSPPVPDVGRSTA